MFIFMEKKLEENKFNTDNIRWLGSAVHMKVELMKDGTNRVLDSRG